jgi:uncharacterized membrane protein
MSVHKIILLCHAIFGSAALVSGFLAIISKKGMPLHVNSGKVYAVSMYGVVISAWIASYFKLNLFLIFIGAFAFYLVTRGLRSSRIKSLKPVLIDWLLLSIGILTAVLMVSTFNLILLVFGAIFIILLIGDLQIFLKIKKGKGIHPKEWMATHLGMMLGSYIAALTAFIVINVEYEPLPWLPWILPSLILTPLIFLYTRKTKS